MLFNIYYVHKYESWYVDRLRIYFQSQQLHSISTDWIFEVCTVDKFKKE